MQLQLHHGVLSQGCEGGPLPHLTTKVNAETGLLKKKQVSKKNINDLKIRSELEWALPAHWTCTPHGAQKAAAQSLGLTIAPDLPGVHAEGTVLNAAGQYGLTPTNGVSTNNVCSGVCAPMIRDMGGWVSGKFFGFK